MVYQGIIYFDAILALYFHANEVRQPWDKVYNLIVSIAAAVNLLPGPASPDAIARPDEPARIKEGVRNGDLYPSHPPGPRSRRRAEIHREARTQGRRPDPQALSRGQVGRQLLGARAVRLRRYLRGAGQRGGHEGRPSHPFVRARDHGNVDCDPLGSVR